MTDPPNATRIAQLLAMTDHEVLAELGAELLPGGLGFGSGGKELARNVAERWVAARRDELRDLICSDPMVVTLLDEEDGRTTTLDWVAALAPLVTIDYGLSTAAAIPLLVFLTRKGLPRFCGTVASESAPEG